MGVVVLGGGGNEIVSTADRPAPPHVSTILGAFVQSKALAEFVGKYRHTLKIRYLFVHMSDRLIVIDRSN